MDDQIRFPAEADIFLFTIAVMSSQLFVLGPECEVAGTGNRLLFPL
jgi:hypothetical protein